MLKGHVFSKQLFGNPIFALFINTFLNGKNGVSNNYKNGMALSYSGNNITIQSGAVCIQGRFLEEDTASTISAGTVAAFCKLVIEIDLSKTNTEVDFQQGAYKVIKSASAYPNLTQTNIVKNNAGVYQYELARFRTNSNGISDFQDKRTFLDFDSIYDEIEQHIQDIDDGNIYVPKSNIEVLSGTITAQSKTTSGLSFNYPTGYNKDNCVVISYGASLDNKWQYENSTLIKNEYSARTTCITLKDNEITYNVYNEANYNCTYDIKIVLMKIS